MTWGGIGASGQFGTINTDNGIAHIDYEEARGDASGIIDNLIVIGLQGRPLSSLAPINGYVLAWDGIAWVPTSVSISGILSHNLLSSTHPDTITSNPSAGDIVAGISGAPTLWGRFPRGLPGQSLSINNSFELEWRDPNIISPLIVISSGSVSLANENKRVIVVKATGSPTEIKLPIAPELGQEVMIKDGKGDSGSPLFNSIHIIPSSGITIDGFSSVYIRRKYAAYTFMWNGTEWNII